MIRTAPCRSTPPSVALLDHFSALSVPRQRWRVLYPLPEKLLLVLCATLSGIVDFVEIWPWGDERFAFLRRLLPDPNVTAGAMSALSK